VPRLVVWAALLVGVAAAGAAAGLNPWAIAGIEFVVWLVVALSERALSRASAAGREPVRTETVAPSPVDEAMSEPEALTLEPDPEATEPEPSSSEPAEAEVPAPREPPRLERAGRSWNVWRLERVLQDNDPDNAELVFLLVYLRDYAGPDGMLPQRLDSLVRVSFGDLLAKAG
jgi:hypothetical protein